MIRFTEEAVFFLCRHVRALSRRGYTLSKVSCNKTFQRGEIQFRPWLSSSSTKEGGTLLPRGWCTCGAKEKKVVTSFLERASAATFNFPGMWSALCSNLKCASKKNRQRNKCERWGSLADPFFREWTTAILSERKVTVEFDQYFPHIAAAIMIGTSSFTAMSLLIHGVDHFNWNHCLDCSIKAPHPHDPDASEMRVWPFGIFGKNDTPFHL